MLPVCLIFMFANLMPHFVIGQRQRHRSPPPPLAWTATIETFPAQRQRRRAHTHLKQFIVKQKRTRYKNKSK